MKLCFPPSDNRKPAIIPHNSLKNMDKYSIKHLKISDSTVSRIAFYAVERADGVGEAFSR